MSVEPSRTQASSLFDDDRSDSDVDQYFDNEDDRQETSEDEEGPRGVLFSPSASSATLGTDGGDDLTSLSHAGFVDLLRTDDRSLALEQAASALVAHLDDLARTMEGRNRDLNALALDVGRLLAEGRAFGGIDEGDEEEEGWRWSSLPEREQSMNALVEEEDEASSDGEDGEDRWPSTSSPSTPIAFRSSNRHLHHPRSPALPLSVSSPYSIRSSPGHAPASNVPPLDLAELTTPVLASLGAIRDQAQISLSASGDAGRRVRAIRATLVTLRAEEDALDRATREVREWEEGRRRGKEQVRAVVEREMGGFRSAMDEFEVRSLPSCSRRTLGSLLIDSRCSCCTGPGCVDQQGASGVPCQGGELSPGNLSSGRPHQHLADAPPRQRPLEHALDRILGRFLERFIAGNENIKS